MLLSLLPLPAGDNDGSDGDGEGDGACDSEGGGTRADGRHQAAARKQRENRDKKRDKKRKKRAKKYGRGDRANVDIG